MSLLLTEEQESIRRVARGFVADKLPIARFREMRDRRDADGFSREAWREMAALGLVGAAIPEAYGGGGLGLAEVGVVLEECGRLLAPTPFLSTVVLGAGVLIAGGTDAQRSAHLGAVCAGERILAVAHEEGTRHARHRVSTRAERVDGAWRLTGEKTMVLDGHVADAIVVAARVSGGVGERDGITLFLVPKGAPGLRVTRLSLVDARNAAQITLSDVRVTEADVVGAPGRGADVLDPALDRATVSLSAEMLGGACEAFDQTIAYLKTRQQFGVPIGSFQALKHRAADLFGEIELTKSIVLDALRAVDEDRPDVAMLASAAKARATDTFLRVANEAIQMHGGVGVTDELDVGFFLKRARVAEMTLGDSAFHRDRFARCLGY